MAIRHPAKYTRSILEAIREEIQGSRRILDPFAGTGRSVENELLAVMEKVGNARS